MAWRSRQLKRCSLMPSGVIPSYAYRPPDLPKVPVKMRTCSSRRARLFAGGTYFRVREPGLPGNYITVEVLSAVAPEPGPGEGYAIITNTTTLFSENVIGNATTKVLDLKGSYETLYLIDQLTTSPRISKYSISCQIAFARQQGQPYTLPTRDFQRPFAFDKVFSDPGKLSVLLQKTDVPFAPGDIISIAPRTRIYALATVLITPEAPSGGGPAPTPFNAFDIAALRAAVNASDPWVEMLERSGPTDDGMGGPPVPNPNPIDAQDPGTDDPNGLAPFPATPHADGDGLPPNPTVERTGPSRSIVFVNYGERYNGTLAETNTVYEWAGDSASSGAWKKY